MLDPRLVARFADHAPRRCSPSSPRPTPGRWCSTPSPAPVRDGAGSAAGRRREVFADLADLKSPVPARPFARRGRAGRAAPRSGSGSAGHDVADLEVAGLLHDVGRVAISNAVWDKPGRLSADEWEQVRLHPYHSERILAGSQRAGPRSHRWSAGITNGSTAAATTAAATADDLSMPARILAAADAYRTLTERRPHRPALAPDQAEQRLLDEAAPGRPRRATRCSAVLGRGRPRRAAPAGSDAGGALRPRGRGARPGGAGLQQRRDRARLVISRRTAEHHVQHIYTKIGVSSRAAATLFAIEHHLLARGIGSSTDARLRPAGESEASRREEHPMTGTDRGHADPRGVPRRHRDRRLRLRPGAAARRRTTAPRPTTPPGGSLLPLPRAPRRRPRRGPARPRRQR